VLVGSYDRKLLWFDLDGSDKPYKTMKIHSLAIRDTSFSPKFALFGSCSDDGKIILQHCKIDEETFSYPLITPLKVLSGHEKTKQGLSVFR